MKIKLRGGTLVLASVAVLSIVAYAILPFRTLGGTESEIADSTEHSATSNVYYVSPSGDDGRSGTSEAQAWATFDRAWQDLYPGDTLILLDGIYYQSLNPNVRNGEPGNPITIRAKNDGQAVIDGEYQRIPVKLGDTWPGPIGDYFVIEGIVARNSSWSVYQIMQGSHNVLRRVSGYDANTDHNVHVFEIWADNNLLEDCIASGTGRKMIMVYKGSHNIIRRCFADWREWDGREWCDTWPWGENINIYFGDYNIVENSIGYGPVPYRSISIIAPDPTPGNDAIGNKILGSIAIYAGMNADGTPKQWGDTRPGPTSCTQIRDFNWPSQRAGFELYGSGELRDNLFQDIFAWGSAGLGLTFISGGVPYNPNNGNNSVNRATVFNNGLDNPDGPEPGQFGGKETDVLQEDLSRFDSIENSYIENIFIEWPDYPDGSRNMTSMWGEGARLTHRYVNGVLTEEPLWPWPMEDRIQAELGISVTDLVLDILAQVPDSGFALGVSPPVQSTDAGGSASYALQVQPRKGFTDTVTLEVGSSPSPELLVDPTSPVTFDPPEGQTTLTLTDLHDPSFTDGLWYTLPVTATGGDTTRTAKVYLLVNGKQAFLPAVLK